MQVKAPFWRVVQAARKPELLNSGVVCGGAGDWVLAIGTAGNR